MLEEVVSFRSIAKFFIFIIFMIFQMILPVLLTPTNYSFQDQVTPPSNRLWVVNQTFTKLDMVDSDFYDHHHTWFQC